MDRDRAAFEAFSAIPDHHDLHRGAQREVRAGQRVLSGIRRRAKSGGTPIDLADDTGTDGIALDAHHIYGTASDPEPTSGAPCRPAA